MKNLLIFFVNNTKIVLTIQYPDSHRFRHFKNIFKCIDSNKESCQADL